MIYKLVLPIDFSRLVWNTNYLQCLSSKNRLVLNLRFILTDTQCMWTVSISIMETDRSTIWSYYPHQHKHSLWKQIGLKSRNRSVYVGFREALALNETSRQRRKQNNSFEELKLVLSDSKTISNGSQLQILNSKLKIGLA